MASMTDDSVDSTTAAPKALVIYEMSVYPSGVVSYTDSLSRPTLESIGATAVVVKDEPDDDQHDFSRQDDELSSVWYDEDDRDDPGNDGNGYDGDDYHSVDEAQTMN